jgi:hypothetical protein
MSMGRPIDTPFTILIDSAEQHPFDFAGIRADADKKYRLWNVRREWRPLGRHPDSLGDYSLDGFTRSDWPGLILPGQLTPAIHIERKSVEDCQATILGFARDGEGKSRRERFEQELSNLQSIGDAGGAALVIVEGTFQYVVQSIQPRGVKPAEHLAKSLARSIFAYMMDFRVPWIFADGRREAEVITFRFLERFWRKYSQESKEVERLVAAL